MPHGACIVCLLNWWLSVYFNILNMAGPYFRSLCLCHWSMCYLRARALQYEADAAEKRYFVATRHLMDATAPPSPFGAGVPNPNSANAKDTAVITEHSINRYCMIKRKCASCYAPLWVIAMQSAPSQLNRPTCSAHMISWNPEQLFKLIK